MAGVGHPYQTPAEPYFVLVDQHLAAAAAASPAAYQLAVAAAPELAVATMHIVVASSESPAVAD